jgi:uncharacterized OB-fold protein
VTGIVYTESIVHAPPEPLAAEAPYQIAIIEFEDGSRVTARIEGERVSIGDRVERTGQRGGAILFRKQA